MIILSKNKQTLQIDEFKFKCSVGKNGILSKKKEGDKTTPKGLFKLGNLYYRADRLTKPNTKLKVKKIKKSMGWCDDLTKPRFYNKLIVSKNKIKQEKLYRKDHKYDLFILIKYNYPKPKIPLGSCIFLHLTTDYKPTAGCIAIKKNDFLVLAKIIKPYTKILIS